MLSAIVVPILTALVLSEMEFNAISGCFLNEEERRERERAREDMRELERERRQMRRMTIKRLRRKHERLERLHCLPKGRTKRFTHEELRGDEGELSLSWKEIMRKTCESIPVTVREHEELESIPVTIREHEELELLGDEDELRLSWKARMGKTCELIPVTIREHEELEVSYPAELLSKETVIKVDTEDTIVHLEEPLPLVTVSIVVDGLIGGAFPVGGAEEAPTAVLMANFPDPRRRPSAV